MGGWEGGGDKRSIHPVFIIRLFLIQSFLPWRHPATPPPPPSLLSTPSSVIHPTVQRSAGGGAEGGAGLAQGGRGGPLFHQL